MQRRVASALGKHASGQGPARGGGARCMNWAKRRPNRHDARPLWAAGSLGALLDMSIKVA